MVHPDVKRHWPVKWQSAVSIPRRHRNPPSRPIWNPKLQVTVSRRILDRTDLLDIELIATKCIEQTPDRIRRPLGPSADDHPWPTAHLTVAATGFGVSSKSCGRGSIDKTLSGGVA